MSETTNGTELVLTTTDLQSAQSVLLRNTSFVSKYEAKHDKLIKQAEKEGVKLTPETDKAINDFIVSAKTCHSTMENDRKQFTQKMDQVKALFTTQENKLVKNLIPTLQAKRDASATAYKKEEAERQRKAQVELDKQKERVVLRANADEQIRTAYLDILQGDKNELLSAFERSDADTIDAVEQLLAGVAPTFKQETYDSIVPVISSQLISKEDCDEIVKASREGKFEAMANHYTTEIKNYANYLHSLIPARREEISDGKGSKIAEEVKAVTNEATVQQQEAVEASIEKQMSLGIAAAVVDAQIEDAKHTSSIPKVSASEVYEIHVLKREGWAEIFKFYFTNSPEQDLGKIKLEQMKAFAEKQAKATGERIVSDALEYEVKQKTQARKAA